eukprot:CAMPEP_0183369964 /NCGR_PEP_ID=MMETSP0164_2-20130417/101091_1 /TAXON_ID=221442 /ORGANISM="Coccolithus pelagicus ssp braarudi, Strain PLY182g" /LENGTH=39 /DNA_ID= /DNA_START= /DNA_END= /DNA_ORIENTATION=
MPQYQHQAPRLKGMDHAANVSAAALSSVSQPATRVIQGA